LTRAPIGKITGELERGFAQKEPTTGSLQVRHHEISVHGVHVSGKKEWLVSPLGQEAKSRESFGDNERDVGRSSEEIPNRARISFGAAFDLDK
jgi:hypothetical protein